MHQAFRDKIMSAEEAARFVKHGDNVGMSGFTGSGQPKVVPYALAAQIEAAQARGEVAARPVARPLHLPGIAVDRTAEAVHR